ncbi:hypothetical protein K6W36_18900, partial [Acetobacter senegalensis]|uniref:hypothetical protein n=1 Tax=Acetobacter senegalensis TaxID=446692 RepID=UPI001EDBF811
MMEQNVRKTSRVRLNISKKYSKLSSEERKLFRFSVQHKGLDSRKLPIVKLHSEKSRLYLSHGQERLWFLWNLIPDDAGYNITGAVRLKG